MRKCPETITIYRCLHIVEAKDIREKIDIVKLNAEIKEIVAREQVLRDEIDKIIAEIEVDG